MKRKIFTTTALVCCFMVCFAIVADLAGKWSGTLKTPDGNEIPLTYTFKTDSGKLTGITSGPQGDITITDGKIISPTDFTFSISVNGTDVKHTGKFYPDADSIGMDIDYQGMKMHTTLKRDAK
ncbi:MAG TPA: hypothetical protein VIM16_10960 [Mucilaginibacter sp.]|jgi:hypothetical protein